MNPQLFWRGGNTPPYWIVELSLQGYPWNWQENKG